ncbi:MAG: hypothetical protein KC910_30035, partial [Candidatus Eremiobacteraeota bacterium]|nr:hypothetical protein [Candidatus Eremiobacteraeota bacterium]
SLWVSVRPTLGTNVGIGFWHALLAQLDLEGKHLPSTVHESVAWAEEMLPPGGKQERLIVVDSFERGGWLWDAGGLAGLDRPIPGVRVIIACRPGAHLAALYRGGAEVIPLDSRDERNRDDLRSYLKGEGLSAEKAETYIERSQGNFLVAQHFVKEGLPQGDIVPGKLSLVLALAWRELLHSLPGEMQTDICLMAGLLSEAPEPLAPASIADFLGLSAARVHGLLEALLPILRNQGEKICLFSRQMQIVISNLLRRDLVATHGRVVAFFRETYPSWEEMNDIYGWMYLGYHCDRLARSSRRRDFSILHWLCEGPYIHSKLARTGSIRAVVEDLQRGLEAALEEGDLPRILAYGLGMPRMRANQTAVLTHHQADSGDFDRALDNARMIAAEGCRFKTFLLLAWQAWEEGRHELAQRILDEALAIPLPQFRDVDLPLVLRILADFAADPDYTEKAFALLALEEEPLRQATYLLGFGRITVLGDKLRKRAFKAGLKCLESAAEGPSRDLREAALIGGLAELGEDLPAPERAPDRVDRKVFSRAKTPQKAFTDLLGAVSARPWDPGRVSGYVELGEALAEVKTLDWVPEAFLQLVQAAATVHVPAERLRAIFGLSSSLSRLERSDKSLEAYERLSALAGAFDDKAMQSKALADIGVGLHRLRSTREGSRSFSEAAAMAFTIEDPLVRSETLSF